jgi:ubiquinone biosynthesis monooxygenase Coq7
MRKYSFIDQLIQNFDGGLKTLTLQTPVMRKNPAAHLPETALSAKERKYAARLMRINHVGEVCAQALYQGQALTARSSLNKAKLEHAALEEQDHLAWCKQRLDELQDHPSYLNIFWYSASLMIGVIAGIAGDKISLGFLKETENQVEKHLSDHLQKLPANDRKSRAIVTQMRLEEIQHAQTAQQAGASELPILIKMLMSFFSKVMTTTAYWV